MKTHLVRRLSKKYLLPNLPLYECKGHLLYKKEVTYLLQGFCFESSAFDKDLFTIYVFVQPLFIPNTYLTFTFGDRLGFLSKGRDIWWKYEETQEKELMDEILLTISKFGMPFLDECNTIEKFLRKYKKLDFKGNPHLIEGVSYALVLNEDYIKAKKILTLFKQTLSIEIKKNPKSNWLVDMFGRVQTILGYLDNQHFDLAIEELTSWKKFTIDNLGLRQNE